jgi:hypothetical protein
MENLKMKKFLLIAALVLLAPAYAVAGGKIDFTQPILDPDDKPIVVMECVDPTDTVTMADGRKECREFKKVAYTLGLIAQRALNLPEQGLDQTASQMRGQLALSVYKSTGAQLTSEEVSTIKKQIAKMYSPIIAFRAAELLGETVPAKKD